MPQSAEYRVEWSSKACQYEIYHGPFTFALTDASWAAWLTMVSSFHFCSPMGYRMTVRKESKERGSGYWYAYKRTNGKVRKKYVGHDSKLDFYTLETIARSFTEPDPIRFQSSPPPQQETPQPPPRQPNLIFTKTLESALHIYGFSTIPQKAALIGKYRELSKQYHPDKGGIHEDMVAVNLAYDYLRKFVNNSW